jgi:tetratricopeptide (TPR) repeat protein
MGRDVIPSSPAAAALQRGQVHESRGEFAAALHCYDHAIVLLRARVPVSTESRRQLGVAWMNRGNAEQRRPPLPGETHADLRARAVAAYDEAIAILGALPFDQRPALRNHLGAAWLNRGHALLDAPTPHQAARSFRRAVAILRFLPLDEHPSYRLNLAGAWINLAHTVSSRSPKSAVESARRGLALVEPQADTDLACAEMSLRARRALAIALGERLRAPAADAGAWDALAAEATDAIDLGLELARRWEERAGSHLRPLALRLLRLGAQLYRIHQPHFLAEFLLEHAGTGPLPADPSARSAACEALAVALEETRKPQLLVAGAVDTTRLLATVQSLRAARDHFSNTSSSSPTSLPVSSP